VDYKLLSEPCHACYWRPRAHTLMARLPDSYHLQRGACCRQAHGDIHIEQQVCRAAFKHFCSDNVCTPEAWHEE
jgi:hypothetical protein